MITLVTGSPGAGKTLFVVSLLLTEYAASGRKIYTNIDGFDCEAANALPAALKAGTEYLPCSKQTPFEWMNFEDGALFVFDEVQEQYFVRNAMAKVPLYVSKFETHRHHGFDFIFITQGPRLLDTHFRALIGRHFNLYRSFNWKKSRLSDWNSINLDPNPKQSKDTALVRTFDFKKEHFRFYKSASLHTMKARVPWRVVGFVGFAFAVLAGGAFFGFRAVVGLTEPDGEFYTNLDGRAVQAAQGPVGCSHRLVAVVGDRVLLSSLNGPLTVRPASLHKGGVVMTSNTQWGTVCDGPRKGRGDND